MENLNLYNLTTDEKLVLYTDAKEKAKYFKALEEELKTIILEEAKGKETIATENHIAMIKKTVSIRLDTKALTKDFPDIKKNYPMQVESVSISVAENANKNPEKKTA